MTVQRLFTFASMVLLVPVVALAHHSYTAEFDKTKPIKLSRVPTKVEWAKSAHMALPGRQGR